MADQTVKADELHRYTPQRMGWTTCMVCGHEAKANIHKAASAAQSQIETVLANWVKSLP